MASLTKDNLQSIRLNELRVCFQLSNAKLGLPYEPTELLEIVNGYLAPLEGFRRLITVAQYDNYSGEIELFSEARFRTDARKRVLVDTGLLKLLGWRERALAKYHATEEQPSAEEALLERSKESESELSEESIAAMCAEVRDGLPWGRQWASIDAAALRQWDRAFVNSFFRCFYDSDRSLYLREVHSHREEVLRWLHDQPAEIHWRLFAADPHCDIQQLARIVDEDCWATPNQENRRLTTCCVFAEEKGWQETLIDLEQVRRVLDAAAAKPRAQ